MAKKKQVINFYLNRELHQKKMTKDEWMELRRHPDFKEKGVKALAEMIVDQRRARKDQRSKHLG